MAGTEQVTLAKALAVKNRLVGRMSQARANVMAFNCMQAGLRDAQTVDVRAEYERYKRLQQGLIVVKAAIQRANAPVYEDIMRLAEIKTQVDMLNGLETKQGKEAQYGGVELQYDSVIRKPEVLELVRGLEGEIDTLQDKLAQYNATTRIELPKEVLDLAR
jgi:hypothetical protein